MLCYTAINNENIYQTYHTNFFFAHVHFGAPNLKQSQILHICKHSAHLLSPNKSFNNPSFYLLTLNLQTYFFQLCGIYFLVLAIFIHNIFI